mmetsp:Transcript_22528/g.34827  ORF Transcript_22528/g.34827 Transcript_22528/m.34827 type:complete len:425 (+) Transcript_22528:47-1321(+)
MKGFPRLCLLLALSPFLSLGFVSRQFPAVAFKVAGGRHARSRVSMKLDPRKQALDGVLNNIEKLYGKGSILKLGDNGAMNVECTSSGAITLDAALGGGLPRGRVVEIYGPESSGKTTLALHALAEVQRAGGIGAFVDAEHALDPAYARAVGVDVDNLLVSQPDSGEMALDVVDQLVRSSAVDLVVVDSVAALVPRAELEGDMGDAQIGLQARLMSKALRKIVGSLVRSQCTVLFINQLRSKVGVIYGSPEVTSGGNALKYYASQRMDIRRRETLRDGSGVRVAVKIVKNKIAPPFKVVELDILFGQGIDTASSLLDAAEELGAVERRGSWYSADGENFAQGRIKAVAYLKETPDFLAQLQAKVTEAIAVKRQADSNPPGQFPEEEAFSNEEEENITNGMAATSSSPSSYDDARTPLYFVGEEDA